MKLHELFKDICEVDIEDAEVSLITDDSRKVSEGCVFVCIKGEKFDGHQAAKEAHEKGACAVVTEHDMGIERQIIVEDTRECYGKICAAWFDHPERKMKFIGVTGTNGKTTMTNVIKYILTANGFKTGLIGTIQNEIGEKILHTNNTTPLTFEFMELLHQMAEEKCDVVVMEVSSFGLCQHRIGPTHFDVSVFTNLTQDHLDYHGTMENYYLAKKMLFEISDNAVINIDDAYGKRLFDEISCSKFSYSRKTKADFYSSDASLSSDKTSFKFSCSGEEHEIDMNMTGMFNVDNISEALAACEVFGIPVSKAERSISSFKGVKGRCEIIPTGRDFTILCDYAHTPDAVENILKSVKEYCKGRLICLFGCGGCRDKTKRPLMAEAAAKYADLLMITSDNPRDEDPMMIIADIVEGARKTGVDYIVDVDRYEAIVETIMLAQKNDIIVLAGKGHEDYQVLADGKYIHFDEREIVNEALSMLK